MITAVNKNNAAAYADLYSTVSDLLRTHDGDNNEVPYGSPDAILAVTPIALDADNYQQDRYYIRVEKYVLCADDAESADLSKTYYETKYEEDEDGIKATKVPVEFSADKPYRPNNFYLKVEELQLASDDKFDPTQTYYESDTITSLDELFAYMACIAKIEPRYTRLPLDEPAFMINPETRIITIPNEFKTNGLSVQGDEIAEVLYFRVPRYYDATDLFQQDILIQWKMGNVEGVSKPWIVDAQSFPGEIIFGWPISSKITAQSGTIEFAVRFYTYDASQTPGKRIRYSLSTLNASATIKKALDFDIEDILVKDTDKATLDYDTGLISDRFVNSPLLNGSVQAEAPTFVKDLIEVSRSPYTFENAWANRIINLGKDENGFASLPVEVYVEAVNSDAGTISYNWKKWNLGGVNQSDELHPAPKYIPTTDTTRAVGKIYYTLDRDGVPEKYQGALADATETIYEKTSALQIDSVGKYTVYATNRVRSSIETTQDPAGIIVVPAPTKPIITEANKLQSAQILESKKDWTLTLVDKHTVNETDAAVLTYQWYKSIDNTTFEKLEGETKAQLSIVGYATKEAEEEGADPIKYVPVDEEFNALGDGYYKVEVTNNLNNCTETIESNVCRVTHEATAPVLTGYSGTDDMKEMNDYQSYIGESIYVSVDMNLLKEAGESHLEDDDKITYQWYKYATTTGSWDRDQKAAAEGTYKINDDHIIVGATEAKLTPTDKGEYYFCAVTNHYNGSTATTCSNFFSVADISGRA